MDQTERQSQPESKEPLGFAGWLILVGIGVFIAPFKLSYNLWTTYLPLFSDGTIADIMHSAALSFQMVIVGELLANLIFLLCSVYLIRLFYKKSATFPRWYLILSAAFLVFLTIDTLALSLIFPQLEVLTEDVIRSFASSAFALLVWTPYLYLSDRAKNTFIT